MVEPVRFGSVQSVSDFGNRNRTEPGFFLTILIGLIGFFFGSVFSVNFFSVFSVYSVFRFFCTPLSSTLLFLFLIVLCSLAKYTFVVEIIRYGQEFLIVLKCLVSLLYKDC
jgi:uncharacterized membrane protein YeaQ/YmgE (transglycosylase-associated protein family)